jgi:hypothetical protein
VLDVSKYLITSARMLSKLTRMVAIIGPVVSICLPAYFGAHPDLPRQASYRGAEQAARKHATAPNYYLGSLCTKTNQEENTRPCHIHRDSSDMLT